MRERRFLVPEIAGASTAEIRGDQAHHLLRVLRLHEGDEIVLFDGQGTSFRGVITRCGKTWTEVRRLEGVAPAESHLELWFGVALPKGEKAAAVIRMLTELGVHRITPLVSERSVVQSLSTHQKKAARWRRIALEACKQSGRSRVPQLEEPMRFRGLLEAKLPPDRILVCPEGDPLPAQPRSVECLVVVGPEGGWTRDEEARAKDTGFQTLGLGPRILRTETAAAATAAIVQLQWGDLSSAGAPASSRAGGPKTRRTRRATERADG